jgi:DNA-binding response OmpR family regulator
LVIDDELDICIMLKVVLESNGFIANYYSSLIVALEEFKSNFYDLIILDMQMSEINGMQLYREVRKRDIKTKICFLTGVKLYLILHTNLHQSILLSQNL